MRKIFLLFVIPAFLAVPAGAVAGELKLTIQNGLVTLIAVDVPLSTILAEWARVGQTKIVNGDKITTPVSLQLIDTPERKALDIVLRAASGYMVAERPTPLASASVYDRIMILPVSRPPANSAPVAAQQPMFVNRPMPSAPPVEVEDEVEEPVRPPSIGQMPPGMNQPMLPGQQPNAQPTGPLTAPRPGPLPQPAPQQPVPFGKPRPPGGGGPGGGGDGAAPR